MADTVVKGNNEAFTTQAKLHQNVAEHTRNMVQQGQEHHDNLMSEIMGSQMSEVAPLYTQWWELFKKQLSQHTDSHERTAENLNEVVNDFDAMDDKIKQIVYATGIFSLPEIPEHGSLEWP